MLGLDPGVTGAYAVVEAGRLLGVEDLPNAKIATGRSVKTRLVPELIADAFRRLLPVDVAYLEEVHAMPKQGTASTFAFGHSFGILIGVLAGLGVPTRLVRPQHWKKLVGVRGAEGSASIARAVQLYPDHAGELNRVKDHNRADAILIAYAGHLSGVAR